MRNEDDFAQATGLRDYWMATFATPTPAGPAISTVWMNEHPADYILRNGITANIVFAMPISKDQFERKNASPRANHRK